MIIQSDEKHIGEESLTISFVLTDSDAGNSLEAKLSFFSSEIKLINSINIWKVLFPRFASVAQPRKVLSVFPVKLEQRWR